MKLKEFITWASFLLWATVLSVPHSIAQQGTLSSSEVSSSGSSNNKPIAHSIAQFINVKLKQFGLPGKIAIPGIGNAERTSPKNSNNDCKKVFFNLFITF